MLFVITEANGCKIMRLCIYGNAVQQYIECIYFYILCNAHDVKIFNVVSYTKQKQRLKRRAKEIY